MPSIDYTPVIIDEPAFLRSLGQAVKAARKRAGLTQEKLSERLGTTAEWVSQIERGVGTPSVTTVLRIAMALAVPVADLLEAAVGGAGRSPEVGAVIGEAQTMSRAAVGVLLDVARSLARMDADSKRHESDSSAPGSR